MTKSNDEDAANGPAQFAAAASVGGKTRTAGLLASLSSAAAVLGAFIAVGQAGTQWIKSLSDAELEKSKATAAMAQDYLGMITKADINPSDKLMLLGALSELKGHPLQTWAKARYSSLEAELADTLQAREQRITALENATDPDAQELLAIQNQLNEIIDAMRRTQDDPTAGDRLEQQATEQAKLLLVVKSKISLKQIAISEVSKSGTIDTSATQQLQFLTHLSDNFTDGIIKEAIPTAKEENVNAYLPSILTALQEFKISDPKLVAYTFAAIAENSPDFSAREEPITDELKSRAEAWKKRYPNDDLVKYRGRGFIQIATIGNYREMSTALGLGDLLVESPEIANTPVIAARILCAWIARSAARAQPALAADDFNRANVYISGGVSNSLESSRAKQTYAFLIAKLH
jgi:predicted chitinase